MNWFSNRCSRELKGRVWRSEGRTYKYVFREEHLSLIMDPRRPLKVKKDKCAMQSLKLM